MKILVLNAGSSSQKSRLYEIIDQPPSAAPTPLWAADADWTQTKDVAELKITANGQTITQELPVEARSTIVEQMLKTLWSGKTQVITQPTDIDIVGHRVVHGGPHYHQSVLITPDVKAKIQHLASFAPLHNPENLKGIEAVERILSNIPQIAVSIQPITVTSHRKQWSIPVPITGLSRAFVAMASTASVISIVHGAVPKSSDETSNRYASSTATWAMVAHWQLFAQDRVSTPRWALPLWKD